MKKKFITAVIAFSLFSCGGSKKEETTNPTTTETKTETTEPSAQTNVDVNSSPESVVNSVFEAAKTGDISNLSKLCAPNGEGDGDTKRLCALKSATEDDFDKYFKMGKISGNVEITDDTHAKVPIMFGPDGTKAETMNLVKIDGKWYLSGF
ncbi:MAG: DUF4878 domain-containing protein [Bacteroidota bacterium]|nr:DUF4878 domain-containing protein [Bacteroidota bacterium]